MLWGLDVGDGAVLRDEGLDDLLLGLPLREVLVDFLHLGDRGVAGAGKGAARMGTAARAHVAALAEALDVHADLFGVLRLRGDADGRQRRDGERKQDDHASKRARLNHGPLEGWP